MRCTSRSAAPLVVAAVLACSAGSVSAQGKLVLSTASHAVLGSVTIENEDLALCDLTSTGFENTHCDWSLFFDGSAAGLNSSVRALDILPDGSLVLEASLDNSIPDISAVKAKDLARFIPLDPLNPPYTSGEWRLYLDGDAVKGASDARVWDAVAVLTDGTCEKSEPPSCDVLLSLSAAGTLGGMPFANEDIIRCHPTAHSVGGSITACQYSMFFDSSNVNGGGAGSFTGNLFAFELLNPTTMLFRASTSANLPAHDPPRDLLRYVGTFGAAPVGTVDLYFDGAAATGGAGLDGETIQAVAIIPGRCGDGAVNVPGEKCDLGDGVNGMPGVPCTADCKIIGKCTGSGDPCQTAAQCPAGQGCCGNAVPEGDEQCDDGNAIPDDLCNNSCVNNPGGIPILGCEGLFGPNVIQAFVKSASFTDTPAVVGPGFDRWKTNGDFNLPNGASIDPDSEQVKIVFGQGSSPTPLYSARVTPGAFVQKALPPRPRWLFLSKLANVPNALGWHKASLNQNLNKVRDNLDGRNVAIPLDTSGTIRVRQTLRSGDDCATAVLTCTMKNAGKVLKCKSS